MKQWKPGKRGSKAWKRMRGFKQQSEARFKRLLFYGSEDVIKSRTPGKMLGLSAIIDFEVTYSPNQHKNKCSVQK